MSDRDTRNAAPRQRIYLAALIGGGLAASLLTLGAMLLLRALLGVRTVPERALEISLLVIPPSVFETMLQRYGFDAKHYALTLMIVLTTGVLWILGSLVLWQRWSVRTLLSLSVALWLLVMVVVMPLSGAGFFALDILDGTRVAIGGYLAVALLYAAALAGVAASLGPAGLPLVAGPPATSEQKDSVRRGSFGSAMTATPSRRSAIVLAAGAVTALLGTMAEIRWGPKLNVTRVVVLEPVDQAGAPSADAAAKPPPAHTPDVASGPVARAPELQVVDSASAVTPGPTGTPSSAATPAANAAPAATATASGSAAPEPASAGMWAADPPPARVLARDKDGLVLPSGRRPGELAEATTVNGDFYVVSKNAAGDPQLSVFGWRLRVEGDVQRSIEVDHRSIRNLPPVEVTKTLECISNLVTKCELAPFGCELISTAQWKGARLHDVLALAGGLKPSVSSIVAAAADDFTTVIPLEAALDPETLLVYEMNGQPLPREHGYPARILVPGRYGMKNAKWVVGLRALSHDVDDWYGQRSWSKQAVVKTMTRIDTPARDAELPPGRHRIAGIAYAGDRGVRSVEFSADGGDTWELAEILSRPQGRDVWVRWEGQFTLQPGATTTLMARAMDGTGELQIEPFSLPQPDGSSGWHSLEVRANPG